MKNIERFGVLSVVGLAVGFIGIIAPIAWDWYRTRVALEIQILRSSTIAASAQGVDKLRFVYDSVEVPDLSRIELAIINTGRTAILESQFVAPVIVAINEGQILEVRLDRTEPTGVAVHNTLSSDKTYLKLSTPLLNSGDALYFTLLASSANPHFTITGRVTGVREVTVRDRRQPVVIRPAPRLTLSLYVVGVTTLGILFLLVATLYTIGGADALEKATKAGLFYLPRNQSGAALRAAITAGLKDFAKPEVKPALDLLEQRKPEVVLLDSETVEIEESLRKGLSNMVPMWPAFWVLTLIFAIGCWYVLGRFF